MCTKERKPRPHAELIKQWADGAVIQYFSKVDNTWTDTAGNKPAWEAGCAYRVKPNIVRTVGYRRYVCNSNFALGVLHVCMVYENADVLTAAWAEKRDDFVEWIDTEWQYHQIEVK